jgi:hypothetical protein
VEFFVNQVNLAEIRPGWVLGHARTVLHGYAKVSVAFYPQPEQQPDALLHRLAEFVHRAEAHRHHDARRKSALHIYSPPFAAKKLFRGN